MFSKSAASGFFWFHADLGGKGTQIFFDFPPMAGKYAWVELTFAPKFLCENKKECFNPQPLMDRLIGFFPKTWHERLNLFLYLKKTNYMIDRMTFYRSFCEKV